MITYPLNNIDYNAEDAELYNCPRKSGVYSGEDFPYTVTGADTNMRIGVGVAWIRNGRLKGKVVANPEGEGEPLNLGLSDPVYPRIDAVVIQFSVNSNKSKIIVKKGVAKSHPTPPEVTRTELLYELHLYHVMRNPGSTVVTYSDVTDKRLDPAYCGLMADSVTEVDTDAINKQFLALLAKIQKELDGVQDGSAYMLKTVYDSNGVNMDVFDYSKVFKATFTQNGWNQSGKEWTQTATCPGILEEYDTGETWFEKTGSESDIDSAAAFRILCSGHMETLNGSIKATVSRKPSNDITIYMRRSVKL